MKLRRGGYNKLAHGGTCSASLGVRLLNRTTRRLALTDEVPSITSVAAPRSRSFTPLRAHGISALAIVGIFLGLHIANHLTRLPGKPIQSDPLEFRHDSIEPLAAEPAAAQCSTEVSPIEELRACCR